MALYLGNQKISLRSGQDPTFDYGFDSNGRLVFANKNAKEINNFLNYDSSYSEILDLSNLSKMEKVAVNGTADRKMEGLKGLLVSPNAPFTGSSPQINASYTGLSKSALVSLFESAPYNVGYTKVGNPTIVDGVASGFSDSDCLQINTSPFTPNNITEIVIKFTPTEKKQGYILGGLSKNGQGGIYLTIVNTQFRDGIVADKIPQQTASIAYQIEQLNMPYYMHFVFDVNTLNWKLGMSTDGLNPVYGLQNVATGILTTNILTLGKTSVAGYQLRGSIDLNETYIKVNGVPWFTGKPAMTKTCSIVGCTGTADLTQEDKNIILNKGWSLTVQ